MHFEIQEECYRNANNRIIKGANSNKSKSLNSFNYRYSAAFFSFCFLQSTICYKAQICNNPIEDLLNDL